MLKSETKVVEKRINDIETDLPIGKSEQELDEYLKQRGVKID